MYIGSSVCPDPNLGICKALSFEAKVRVWVRVSTTLCTQSHNRNPYLRPPVLTGTPHMPRVSRVPRSRRARSCDLRVDVPFNEINKFGHCFGLI